MEVEQTTGEGEAIATLLVALQGGHGLGIAWWLKTNVGLPKSEKEPWDWKKAAIMTVAALIAWGLALLTGHSVSDVGAFLSDQQNAAYVTLLTLVANMIVTAAYKWWTTGDPRPTPTAPPST